MSDALRNIRPLIAKTNYKRLAALKKKENWILLSMCAPTLLWLLLFRYLPMSGLLIAFQDFRSSRKGFLYALQNSEWVGLENFRFLFHTRDAWVMTRNTLAYNFVFIFVGLVLCVALAIIIHEIHFRLFSKTAQTILIMPNFLSWITVSFFAFAFLSTDNGLINQFLVYWGFEPIAWFNQAKRWPYILITVHFWKTVGFGSVIYLAALSGIDVSMYESARIDGAGKFRQIIYLTIPSLVPIMTILTILAVGRIFFADFGLFYILPGDRGILFPVTTVIDTYVFRALVKLNDVGMATAAGLYQSLVGLVLVYLTNLWVRKINPESALF